MKKLAAVLLMISSLVMSASAFAATSEGVLIGDSKNGKSQLQKGWDSVELKANMPCFGLNDVLQFNIQGLTTEKQLTLISYRVNEQTLSDANIQYVNQYTLGAEDFTVKYTIRDTEDGIYRIVVNCGDGSIVDFYYKVGIPTYNVVNRNTGAGTNYYLINNNPDGSYSVGFLGKITMDSTDVSFDDAGIVDVGFELSGIGSDGKDTTLQYFNDTPLTGLNDFAKYGNIEIEGSVTFIYGMELHNIPVGTEITADAIVKTKTGGTAK